MLTPPSLWLAPMEGVVDSIMRETLTGFGGIQACVTEFMRVTELLNPNHVFSRYCPELSLVQGHRTLTANGVPVYFQLLGGQPEPLALNAVRAIELGATGIDLNFGCPAPTVNRHDGGATLLKYPERIFKIVSTVRKAVPSEYSVSAKIRLGFSDPSLFSENADACAKAGASWLTVHARTRDDQYRPPAKWEYLRPIQQKLEIPMIANGEIWTPEDARQCRAITGIDRLMLGRGLLARPSLAHEIQTGAPMTSWTELLPILNRFIKRNAAVHSRLGVTRTKQWLKWLSRTYPEAAAAFEQIKRLETVESLQSSEVLRG